MIWTTQSPTLPRACSPELNLMLSIFAILETSQIPRIGNTWKEHTHCGDPTTMQKGLSCLIS
jgi:hypothetical protein